MKAVVAAFNQEKALVGAFSVITNTNLRMDFLEALLGTMYYLPLLSGAQVTAVLGSLVSYGGITFLCSTAETIAIGSVSALICFFGNCVTTVGAKCRIHTSTFQD